MATTAARFHTTMFKSAAAKIAHNSTLPALGASKDLRPLQDLITAEKAVLQSYVFTCFPGVSWLNHVIISLQRLSADIIKSSDCLKAWGAYEGDDLSVSSIKTTNAFSAHHVTLGYPCCVSATSRLYRFCICPISRA